jgi:hypothetical protein
MPVNLLSAGGGTTTLTTASSASNFTVTLPAASGTLATTAGVVSSLNGNTGALAGYELITSGTVSSGATSINIGSLPSGYKTFKIFYTLTLSAAGTVMNNRLRVSTDGGSSYISTNNYYYHSEEWYSGGVRSLDNPTLDSGIEIGRPTWTNPGGVTYWLMEFNIIQSTNSSFVGIFGTTASLNLAYAGVNSVSSGFYNQTTYVNGIQLTRTSGSVTYTNGGYIVYGAK